MPTPNVTVKAFSEFIHTPLYAQMRILHEQKYPKQSPAVFKMPYYAPTRRAILRYYRQGNDASHFPIDSAHVPSGKSDARENNFRSMQSFLNGSHAQRNLQVATSTTFESVISTTIVRFTPDVVGLESNGRTKYIVFDCTQLCPDREFIDTLIELAHFTLLANQVPVQVRDIEYIHLQTDQTFHRTTIRQRTITRATATARAIAAIWPTI
jgi:hypothetical protein